MAAQLAGCGALLPRVVTVKVPVPMPCAEAEPERPPMPTDALRGTQASLYDVVQAAHGEIVIREAYEGRLRAALSGCTRRPERPPD